MTVSFPETVVFDLDGTLIDTAPDIAAALNAVLMRRGRATVSLDDVRHMVGRGARVLIQRVLDRSGVPGTPQEIAELVEQVTEQYSANIAVMSRPFAGAEATARRLIAEGRKVGICTNKREGLSYQLLEALSLRDLFPVILGADSRPYRKPDPRHLLDTIAALGGSAQNAVLIGDSETDVSTARAAKVPVIAVSFGYTETPARELGADVVIDSFDELERAFSEVRNRST